MFEFERRVGRWCVDCFGETTAADARERVYRFLEEALELAQSLGCTEAQARELAAYVFDREIGEPQQEVGGVMVTLAALTFAKRLDLEGSAAAEIERIELPEIKNKIRLKQASKPHGSPLPGDYKYGE
jgi:hypothetical protein